jgi:hypothetical protein
MAFCSKCGAKLDGDERFCAACGNVIAANGAAVPVGTLSTSAPVASAAASAPSATASMPRPVPPAPVPYPAQPPIPIIMGPPPGQPKRNGVMWTLIIVPAVLVGLYYIGTHKTPAQPGGTPGQPPASGQQPGAQQQPPAPEQAPPSGQTPPTPAQTPGGPPPQSGANQALVQLQLFSGQWHPVNGYVQISEVRWTNRSNVAIQSAIFECDQLAANGSVLAPMRTTLNGPVQSGGTDTFNTFNMGSLVQGLSDVKCGIVAVTPVS